MKLTGDNRIYTITFDDIAEGRVRLFVDGKLENEAHFDTYGQALRMLDELRDEGWLTMSPNVEAIENLLRTAELYEFKAKGMD
mgnify:CR=1 FL=1